MALIKCKQGSFEWLALRAGAVTASRVGDVMAVNKDGKSSERRNKYLIQLVCERLTGFAQSTFVTDAMARGIEQEPLARAAYEFCTGQDVDIVGMYAHPRIERFLASPDGIIGADGLWEGKAPTTAKHVEWMMGGGTPVEHKPQMYSQMACSGRQWCAFTSFDTRIPDGDLQLFIPEPLQRNEEHIAQIEEAVIYFLAEVDVAYNALRSMSRTLAAPQVLRQQLEDSLGITDEDFAASPGLALPKEK